MATGPTATAPTVPEACGADAGDGMLGRLSFDVEEPDGDARRVRRAAALLRIPEFAFFRLAWRRWYGEEPDDRAIEPHFMLYLFRHRVPPWARHLARQVAGEQSTDPVRPEDYGVTPVLPPPPPERRAPGLILGAFYAACFVAFTLAAL